MSKVIVLTGATSGIGEAAAFQLAEQGHRLVLIARSEKKAASTIERLPSPKSQKHTFYLADMSSVADIKLAASRIVAAEPHIDVLINNAGAHFASFTETEDKVESTIAVNHLAYFVLTLSLKPSLHRGSRVVNTSSHLHRSTRFERDNLDLRTGRHYGVLNGFDNYNRSKLYNVLFTRQLSQLWATSEGISVNCCHPGLIRSNIGDGQFGLFEPFFWLLVRAFGRTTKEGGDVLVWLATSTDLEGTTGQYYNRYNLEAPSRDAVDFENARILWKQSLEWSSMDDVPRKGL